MPDMAGAFKIPLRLLLVFFAVNALIFSISPRPGEAKSARYYVLRAVDTALAMAPNLFPSLSLLRHLYYCTLT